MGSFNGLLDAKFMPPRNWSLDAPLKFKSQTLTKEEREMLEKMLKKRFSKEFRDFEDERLLEDMIEDEYFNSSSEGPNEDDIIH